LFKRESDPISICSAQSAEKEVAANDSSGQSWSEVKGVVMGSNTLLKLLGMIEIAGQSIWTRRL
jgi:hypothetical protein